MHACQRSYARGMSGQRTDVDSALSVTSYDELTLRFEVVYHHVCMRINDSKEQHMQIELPNVNIGAYGRIVRDLDDNACGERFMQHSARVEELKRELAAEMQRRDIAYTATMARMGVSA